MAEASSSPHQTLTDIYQHLLGHRPCLSPDLSLVPCRERRKADGLFYTPPALAQLVVAEALRALPARTRRPRLIDLSMGTGVFLLAAVRALAADGAAAAVAETCLYGVDRDPIAVELAIHALWLETGARPAVLARHLQCADPLAGPTRGAFDLVVGNPPWGAQLAPEVRNRLAARFNRSTIQCFDSFKLFLDLASRLSRGSVGMIVPQAVLGQSRHGDIRSVLLERLDPYFAAYLGDRVFVRAQAPACALVFGPKPGPRTIRCLGQRSSSAVPARFWTPAGFPLTRHDLLALLGRLQDRYPSLGALPRLYRVRDAGINYNRASVARRALYRALEPDDERDVPRYRGRSFGRYTRVQRDGWLRHDAQLTLEPGESIYLDRPTYACAQKVVLRQTSDRIVATLDTSRMAMGRSVLAITAEGDASLHALLACLNSRLLTALYRALAGEEGRALPQVKVNKLQALPVALPIQDGERATWTQLDALARRQLAAEGEDGELDAAIDAAVYRLYALSERESALVEDRA